MTKKSVAHAEPHLNVSAFPVWNALYINTYKLKLSAFNGGLYEKEQQPDTSPKTEH